MSDKQNPISGVHFSVLHDDGSTTDYGLRPTLGEPRVSPTPQSSGTTKEHHHERAKSESPEWTAANADRGTSKMGRKEVAKGGQATVEIAAPNPAPAEPPATPPAQDAEIERVIERMQMDIDDGSRPDQWSMQSMQADLRKAADRIAALSLALRGAAQDADMDTLDMIEVLIHKDITSRARIAALTLALRGAEAHNTLLAGQVETLERMDKEAATHVESVICMRTHFTGEPPYVGWKGLGLALTEALDQRDAAERERDAAVKALREVRDWLADERLTKWVYMEGDGFYHDRALMLTTMSATLDAPGRG